MRFEELYQQWTQNKLTIAEAAEILGVHERTFRRWRDNYEEQGAGGLYDRRLERIAHNAAPVDEVMELLSLFETRYPTFTTAHFFDKYRDEHQGQRSYTWVKRHLQDAGLTKKAKKRGAHRRKRERQPMKGMLIHQDGSTHEWVPGHMWDLIVTMDDADNEIYSMFFVDEEGTFSSFRGVQEVIDQHGLFCSFYSDRGSHYWHTPKEGGKVDKDNVTQFGRAMKQLGIEMIPAYSPEARGRSERMFGTLQGRLPKELALAGITKDMAAANRYLKETFLPMFNARFKKGCAEEATAFVPCLHRETEISEILSVHTERRVSKANTVSYKGKELQISRQSHRYSYAGVRVTVHEYEDGSMSIYHGPRCLGRFDSNGRSDDEMRLREAA